MQYIVKQGDTLSLIAKANNTTIATLKRLNPSITDIKGIQVGQTITLPNNQHPIERQTKDLGQVCARGSCDTKYVDLIHLNIERKIIPLTAAEQAEFAQEEATIAQLINQFTESVNALSTEGITSAELAKQKQQCYIQLTRDLGDGFGSIIAKPSKPVAAPINPTGTQSSEAKPAEETEVAELETVDLFKIKEIRRLMGEKSYNYVRTGRLSHTFERDEFAAANSEQAAESAGWYDPNTRKVKPSKMLEGIEFDKKILEQKYEFFDWALAEWKDEHDWPNAGPIDIKVSREANLLRFAANASASMGFSTEKRSFTFGAKANAQFSIADASAKTKFMWPAEGKTEMTIDYTNSETKAKEQISFGHIKAYIELAVSGFIGVTVALAANVNASLSKGLPTVRGSTRGDLLKDDKTGGDVNAFAGGKIGTQIEGGIDWVDTLTAKQDWLMLVKLGNKIEAAYGAGLKIAFKIGFNTERGQFYFRIAAGVILGAGATGEIAGEFDMKNIATMVHFIYNALLKVDFHKVEIFDDKGAFDAFCNMGLYALVAGTKMIDASITFISSMWEFIKNIVNETFSSTGWSERKALKLSKNILTDIPLGEQSWVLHAPPEVKGRLLWMLSYLNTLSVSNTGDTLAQEAVGQLLMTSQGSRDFQEMLCRMNPKGTKGSQQDINDNTVKIAMFLRDSKYQNFDLITNIILKNYLSREQKAVADAPVITQRFIKQADVYAIRMGGSDGTLV